MRASSMIVALCVSGCARGQATGVVVPPRQPPGAARASERGDVELGLGVVTAVVSGVLLGVGTYGAWRAAEVRRYCGKPEASDDREYDAFCTTPFGGDPAVGAAVSSSLSFAFAVPIAVASGFLLRRGVTARRAWQQARPASNLSLRAWSNGQHSAGLRLDLRF